MTVDAAHDAMPARPLPLSHPLRVETIKLRGTRVVVAAREQELQAIAAELGLASLEALQARYELFRNGETVKLEGVIAARMHQNCIVTLDAFAVEIEVPVRLDFAPGQPSRPTARRAEAADAGPVDIEVNLNEDDPPEPIVDGVIDLGAVTLEFLALSLDPYPRKPGVSFAAAPIAEAAESPFAALARLKRES